MFCPHCGKESAPQANFCTSCGAAAVAQPGRNTRTRIVRPRHPRMIAGVCSGVAIHYGWSIPWTRILLAVFTCLTSGVGGFLYIAAWILLPDAPYALPPVINAVPGPSSSYGQSSPV